MGQNEVPEGIATKMLSNFEKRHGALSSAPSGDAQIDAQNRAKAAGFKFVQEDRKSTKQTAQFFLDLGRNSATSRTIQREMILKWTSRMNSKSSILRCAT